MEESSEEFSQNKRERSKGKFSCVGQRRSIDDGDSDVKLPNNTVYLQEEDNVGSDIEQETLSSSSQDFNENDRVKLLKDDEIIGTGDIQDS